MKATSIPARRLGRIHPLARCKRSRLRGKAIARARTKLRALQATHSSFQNGLEVDAVDHDDSVTGNPQPPGLGTSNTDPRTQRFVQREESKAVQSGGDDTAGGSDDEDSLDESQASEDDIHHEMETGWSQTKREAMLYGAPDDQDGALSGYFCIGETHATVGINLLNTSPPIPTSAMHNLDESGVVSSCQEAQSSDRITYIPVQRIRIGGSSVTIVHFQLQSTAGFLSHRLTRQLECIEGCTLADGAFPRFDQGNQQSPVTIFSGSSASRQMDVPRSLSLGSGLVEDVGTERLRTRRAFWFEHPLHLSKPPASLVYPYTAPGASTEGILYFFRNSQNAMSCRDEKGDPRASGRVAPLKAIDLAPVSRETVERVKRYSLITSDPRAGYRQGSGFMRKDEAAEKIFPYYYVFHRQA
ncbi:hypothetical protein C8R43DRAFT_942847 [Mycena crocata]|nr:hypothetical protein C8R43DRAFT_942847 [Mycena crocata]